MQRARGGPRARRNPAAARLLAALLHHLLGGIRHFIWDLGYGFKPNEREALTWITLVGGIALTVLVWIAGYAIGGGR